MDDLTIRVSDLEHTYPGQDRPAVDGMSFEVARGEVFGFLGPNGAGKTTTQGVLTGLLRGWRGTVEVLGRPVGAWGPALYDRIGVAFELPVGWPRLTGREDLVHFSHLHDGPTRDVDDLMAEVGLAAAADQPIGTWSKGMRMRLNLARALLHDPGLVFLDEPTSGLDPVNVATVRSLVLTAREAGRTIFLTTHDMATAAAVCDRVAFVVDGSIAASGPPRALQLAHGESTVRVVHRKDGGLTTSTFPLGSAPAELVALLASGSVETIATNEASLDDVFVSVTGRQL